MTHCGYGSPGGGQHAVEAHLVGQRAAGLQAVEDDERVVMAGDGERRRGAPQHVDLARRVGLHPDGRLGVRDVAQQWSENEAGLAHHAVRVQALMPR
jgi:hypothetical protein